MKIEIAAGTFDLNSDTKISLNLQNPMLSDQGSYSYPFSVKGSRKNMALCGMPNQIDKAYYKTIAEKVKVTCDNFEIGGVLKTTAASKDSIELNIEANEGAFWSSVKKLKLTELNWELAKSTPDQGLSTAYAWVTYFNKHIKADNRYPKSDYAIFPVCMKIEEEDSTITYNIVNPIAHDNLSDPNAFRLSGIYENRDILPFLWLNTVIDYIAGHFNLRIVRNDLRDDDLASTCVVLHNNAGSTTNGFLNYAHIVPDCTVEEFIEAIEFRFCCFFFFDYSKGELRIIQFKNISLQNPSLDLTEYLSSDLTPSISEGKAIKLKAGNSFERAEISGETQADFPFIIQGTIDSQNDLPAVGAIFSKKAWYVTQDAGYYAEVAGDTEADYNKVLSYKRVSSKYFAYKSAVAEEYENRESKEEQCVSISPERNPMSYQLWPYYNTGFVQRSGTNFFIKNAAENTPLCFVPYVGIKTGTNDTGNQLKYPCGSTDQFTMKEMFNRYYVDYSLWKQRSCKSTTVTLRLPSYIVSKLTWYEIYTIKNQPFIIKNIPLTMSNKGIEVGSVELVTVKPYL